VTAGGVTTRRASVTNLFFSFFGNLGKNLRR
jgi:hypothetical protein